MKIGRKRKSRRERLIEHAAALAPPEEKAGHLQALDAAEASTAGNGDQHQHLGGKFGDGSIILDTRKLHLPGSHLEETEKKNRLFGIEPVVLVILAVALSFICFIAYLISAQPPK